jgi:FkbM family methyltransferase
MLSQMLTKVAPRLGMRAEKVAPGSWLLQRGDDGSRLRTTVLEDDLWLLQKPQGRRTYRTRSAGSPDSRAHLVYAPRAARRNMQAVQRKLGQWLLEEQVLWVFRALDIDVVLDVGANVGQYARRLRRAGYTGRIISFEPLAEFADKLRQEAAGDPLWDVHQYALGDEDTTAEINATPGLNLSSLLPASDFGKRWSSGLREPVTETIQVHRLDSVLPEMLAGIPESRVFLKLDTQGYDLPAFRGAGACTRDILALQSEVSCVPIYEDMPPLETQLAEYRSAGFDLAGMYPVSRHARTLRVIEFDAVLVRGSAFGGDGSETPDR